MIALLIVSVIILLIAYVISSEEYRWLCELDRIVKEENAPSCFL